MMDGVVGFWACVGNGGDEGNQGDVDSGRS
jgi:hypothetical protein